MSSHLRLVHLDRYRNGRLDGYDGLSPSIFHRRNHLFDDFDYHSPYINRGFCADCSRFEDQYLAAQYIIEIADLLAQDCDNPRCSNFYSRYEIGYNDVDTRHVTLNHLFISDMLTLSVQRTFFSASRWSI